MITSLAILLACGLSSYGQNMPGDRAANPAAVKEFVNGIKERVRTGDIDLSQKFSVEYRYSLNKSGNLDTSGSKVAKSSGDPKLSAAAVDGIRAMEKAGYFIYLDALKAKKGKISVAQNGKDFSVVLKSEYNSQEEALGAMAGLATFLAVERANARNSDDKLILQNIKFAIDDDFTLVVRFAVPASQMKQLAS